MRKNKLITVLGLSLAVVGLASCGEKPDTTLYSVELSSNITLTAAQKAGLTAELAFGADGKGSRDEYEVEELKKAGATDADIEKVGKLQDDGKYYFYDQDPMYLNAPEVEDYMFRGFYEKGTDKFVYKRYADATTGLDNRWNCPGKNIELEARYVELTYTINYCWGDNAGSKSGQLTDAEIGSNIKTYKATQNKGATLVAPTYTPEGYQFKGWFVRNSQVNQKIEALPNEINESYMHELVSGQGNYELQLWADYEILHHNITVTGLGHGVTMYQFTLTDNSYNQTVVTDFSSAISVEHGTMVDMWLDLSEVEAGYEFEGIYINGTKAPDIEPGRPNNRPDQFPVNEDTTIEVRVVAAE